MNLFDHAAQLREDFDLAFTQPPPTVDTDLEALLAIRLAGHPYALRLSEISALVADKVITAVPTGWSDFLGIAGFRGSLLPVYDLSALLGYRREQKPRWMVLAAGSARLALAFDGFDGDLRVPRRELLVQTGTQPHIQAVTRTDLLPVLNVANLVNAISERVRESA